jgi:hypothetical protein
MFLREKIDVVAYKHLKVLLFFIDGAIELLVGLSIRILRKQVLSGEVYSY